MINIKEFFYQEEDLEEDDEIVVENEIRMNKYLDH